VEGREAGQKIKRKIEFKCKQRTVVLRSRRFPVEIGGVAPSLRAPLFHKKTIHNQGEGEEGGNGREGGGRGLQTKQMWDEQGGSADIWLNCFRLGLPVRGMTATKA